MKHILCIASISMSIAGHVGAAASSITSTKEDAHDAQFDDASYFVFKALQGIFLEINKEWGVAFQDQDEARWQQLWRYENSLAPHIDQLKSWDTRHEAWARELADYISITQEWDMFVANSKDLHVYGILHNHMCDMAGILIDGKPREHYGIVNNTHHRVHPRDSDAYDRDRIVLLTLYLLDKKLQKMQSSGLRRNARQVMDMRRNRLSDIRAGA